MDEALAVAKAAAATGTLTGGRASPGYEGQHRAATSRSRPAAWGHVGSAAGWANLAGAMAAMADGGEFIGHGGRQRLTSTW